MHKKRVSGKEYFYTTIRKGNKTRSVYLGNVYKEAIRKEKESKGNFSDELNIYKKSKLIDMIVLVAIFVAVAFLLKLPFTGFIVYEGDAGVDDNNVSIITLPESNVNVSENVVLQPDVSLPVIQDVAKIYIKPNINVRNKLNKKGVYNLSKREDKFDLDAEVDGNKIKIKGLRTTKDIDVVFGRSNGANSDFIYAEVDEIENAEVRVKHDKLVLSGVATGRNPILICNNFSISTLECDEWSPTGDYAYDGGGYYIFNVTHFTAYTVGSPADYSDISQCLFFVNGTTDSCSLNDANTIYNMSGSTTWLSDADLYNKTGMVAGYNFSDTGDYTAIDISGMGNNGAIQGSALNGTRTLNSDSPALAFDKLNDYVNITNSQNNTDFNFTQFSVMAWVNTTDNKNQVIVGRGIQTANMEFRFNLLDSSIKVGMATRNPAGTVAACASDMALTRNKWYHVAATWNGTDKLIYINGKLNKTCNWVSDLKFNRTDSIKVGRGNDNFGGSLGFNGSLDEVAIYNRTLTSAEISAHAWGHFNNYETYGGGASGVSAIKSKNHNQTLDCAGKWLKGNGNGIGLDWDFFTTDSDELENTTIMNCNLDWFNKGLKTSSTDLTLKNMVLKNSVIENIELQVGAGGLNYTTYMENVTLINSSTEDNLEAIAGGLTNITIINMNSSYAKKTCATIISADYYKIINSYFYNSTSDTCVSLSGTRLGNSLFANNIVKYSITDNKYGLIIGGSNAELLVENNTISENNINFVTSGDNWVARNNTFNTSYELDFVSGAGANVLIADGSDNNKFIGNHIYNSAENGIAMLSTGGGVLIGNNVTNNSIYNTSAGWDLYIVTVDVYNTSIWLNNFYSKGVNNGSLRDLTSSESNFCINNEGNFYEENIGTYSNSTYRGWNECGQSNFSTPLAGDTVSGNYNISWRKQSSINDINYTLQIRDSNNVWSNITTTSSLSYILNTVSYADGNYLLRISPFDDTKRATNYTLTSTISINNPTTTTSAAGGGGGGGSSGGAPRIITGFKTDKQSIITRLGLAEVKTEELSIINEQMNIINIEIDIDESISGLIDLSDRKLDLKPSETKIIKINVKSSTNVGIYTGNILIRSNDIIKKIPLIIEVESKERNIDINLDIVKDYRVIKAGEEISAQVTLFDIGDKKNKEVSINYIIKGMDGVEIKRLNENINFSDQISFNKRIVVPENLKDGVYVLGIEVVYANSVSLSSQIFEIVSKEKRITLSDKELVYFLLVSLALIFVLILVIKFIKRKI